MRYLRGTERTMLLLMETRPRGHTIAHDKTTIDRINSLTVQDNQLLCRTEFRKGIRTIFIFFIRLFIYVRAYG